FFGNEKKYLNDCIDSTFVSSVGTYVDRFEKEFATRVGSKYAIATVNGTAALHTALLLAGVAHHDEVLTQSVSFVATPNAITYCGAQPIFLDSDKSTLGLSPTALESFLIDNCHIKKDGYTYNLKTGRKISACVPVHIFGHPARIDQINKICNRFNITLVEDAAEALGSYYNGKHAGRFGKLGILSFNGNKIITTGGGGMILTDDDSLAKQAKHITTTAKKEHGWEYFHDQTGYNYRMPNINAALGCAQMENIHKILINKRNLASSYNVFFKSLNIPFVEEPEYCVSNYWLNAIITSNKKERDGLLTYSNKHKVMMRPLWTLLHRLPMYNSCQTDSLKNARWLEQRIVNIPSSVTQ
ncbi:MAG: LegC family aminotransferase, partial [Thiotrichaceae bacterium]|nr:LegC family aminotransferase [Thiotrichaceae bacterium]